MSSRSAKERIQDIVNAIDSIQVRTAGMSFDQFGQDETIGSVSPFREKNEYRD